MPNSTERAISIARSKHRPGLFSTGTCLMQVRICFGVAARYPSAASAWLNAKAKHPTSHASDVPRGGVAFWTGGAHGYGHVAIGLGDGLVETTDFVNRGGFGTAHIDDITRRWGLKFVGWSEDVNGVTVWEKPAPPVGRPVTRPASKPAPTNPLAQYRKALEQADKDYGVHIKKTRPAAQRLRAEVKAALSKAPKE